LISMRRDAQPFLMLLFHTLMSQLWQPKMTTTNSLVARCLFSMTTGSRPDFMYFFIDPHENRCSAFLLLRTLRSRIHGNTSWQLTPRSIFAFFHDYMLRIFCVFWLIPRRRDAQPFLMLLLRTLRPRSHGNIMTTDSSVALCFFSIKISTFFICF
jgi:hypothetical protein